ncbi:hypothetical protein C8R47DRAFT_982324 [Mycena vitilis]|nr:hypothetical protein C8R47DRAFT_982324 [Mycena vitilis]
MPSGNCSDIPSGIHVDSPPSFQALRDPNLDFGRLDTISLPGIHRAHPTLWLPSGNLIVHAGNTIFRISREVLASKSSVLEELLGPKNLSTYNILDGCEVLPMPHSETDAEHFLQAILCSSFDSFFVKDIGFDVIAAIVRVNLDYQIPHLSQKALILLSSAYPTTLADFTSVGFGGSYHGDPVLAVIQFARAHSVDWILPLAFYRYCLEGTSRDMREGIEFSGKRVILSREEEGLCNDARYRLQATSMDAHHQRHLATHIDDLLRGLVIPGDECRGGADCRKSRIDEGDALLHRLCGLSFMPRLDFVWTPQPESKLCGTCLQDMHRWHVQQRQSVWDSLPALFNLPDWSRLNEIKDIALREGDEEA